VLVLVKANTGDLEPIHDTGYKHPSPLLALTVITQPLIDRFGEIFVSFAEARSAVCRAVHGFWCRHDGCESESVAIGRPELELIVFSEAIITGILNECLHLSCKLSPGAVHQLTMQRIQ